MTLLFLALYTLVGFLVGYLCLSVGRRLSGMNEFSRIKSSLAKFVSTDKRIQSLFPPPYVSSSISPPGKRETPKADWLSESAGGVVEVKASIEKRIERAAIQSPEFAEALRYAFIKSGKMIRSRLVILLGRCFDFPDENQLLLLAQAVELLHSASLLHDDVVDEADMRRGVESHRKKLGDKSAILTGDNMISILVDVLTEINNMQVTECVSESIEALVIGELLQLTYKSSSNAVTLDPRLFPVSPIPKELGTSINMYLRKSYFKTASLFACLGRCVGFITDRSKEDVDRLGSFGFFFGLAFQLIDDLLDLEMDDDDGAIGKPVGGSDIRNGTVTLPVLLATESDKLSSQEREELGKMLKRRFKLGGDPEGAIALIAKSDAIEKSREVVSYYMDRCRSDLLPIIQDTEGFGALASLFADYQSRQA